MLTPQLSWYSFSWIDGHNEMTAQTKKLNTINEKINIGSNKEKSKNTVKLNKEFTTMFI